MKIVTVVGARPQFIKAAVVSRAIKDHNENNSRKIKEIIIHTGQHYDKNMSDVFFEEMHIPKPDYQLNINGLSHGSMTGQMLEKIESVLVNETPDYMMVYGDTNSTISGALAAAKLHIPVVHIEAGLRSYNRKMPEEINRVLTDHLSTLLFCPTNQAVENLKMEGVFNSNAHKVKNTGDVMLDAAIYYKKYMKKPDLKIPVNFILSTIHRAENTDNPERLQSIFDAFSEIAKDKKIIIPLHPRTKNIVNNCNIRIRNDNLMLIDPVGYYEMLYFIENCDMVMTDSGGLQKEAYFFKKPCLTLRDQTEWVELVMLGYNCITGTSKENICNSYFEMKDCVINDTNIFGKGNSGKEIVSLIINH